MIIISQDGNNIINFDNVERIYINEDFSFAIECTTITNWFRLGEYDTVEECRRAFVKLQEDMIFCNQEGVCISKRGELNENK